jgi:PhnB protein
MAVKPIPDGYHTVTPYLTVSDLRRLVQFTVEAFGAKPSELVPDAEGDVRHAEVRIGDSVVMIGQARAEWPPRPATLYLYVEDAHAAYKRAVDAGGKSLREPETMFYGDINAGVEDPLGNQWWIATHVEDVPPEEMERRAKEHMK